MRFLFLIFSLLFYCISIGQTIGLDSTFNIDSKLSLSIYDQNEIIDIITLSNDSLLILGQTGKIDSVYFNMDMFLVKTDSNGILDNSYGNNGIVVFDFPMMDYSKPTNILSIDNFKYIVGYANTFDSISYNPICVARVNNKGEIDTTFGDNGTFFVDFYNINELSRCLINDDHNKFYIGGGSFDTIGNHYVPVIARYNNDFTIDSTFGSSGKLALDLILGNRPIRHLADGQIMDIIIYENKIYIAGNYSYQGFIMKLNYDGSLDLSFNETGYIIFDLDIGYFQHEVVKLLTLPNGRIIFGMNVLELTQGDFYIGTIDTSNGSYTLEYVDFNEGEDFLTDLKLTSSNAVVAVAKSIDYDNAQQNAFRSDYFSVVKFADFNNLSKQDKFTYRFDNFQSGALACTTQSNDKIVVGGFTFTENAGESIGAIIRVSNMNITSIKEYKNGFSIYPNPTNSKVKVIGDFPYPLQVYNSLGQIVLISTKSEINLRNLPNGYYYIESSNSQVFKLIKN